MTRLEWLLAELCSDRSRDECWVWPFAKIRKGYGNLKVDGKSKLATHVALEATIGLSTDPDKQFALHSCDNPPCFNPAHLRWGNHFENHTDAIERRRKYPVPTGFNKTEPVTCCDCGETCERTGQRHLRCPVCKKRNRREYDAAYKRALRADPIKGERVREHDRKRPARKRAQT